MQLLKCNTTSSPLRFRVYEIRSDRVNLGGRSAYCSDYTHRGEFVSKAVVLPRHGKVFTLRSTRVHKVAVTNALISIVSCIIRHGVVPSHRANADGCSSSVVSVEVVLW
ncbi:Pathoproteinsis-related protein 1 [Hibiscus syriacus]|uniref:Pathoproteinsis-related protein 1 n=1 Tax=Hibiscus syriacus TaxID=106335 RepID=A0A6A2ZMN3_HIBSY|nr:Pathoproteinsis-related protein 1 [Hibiscus syriacus]